jgi:hypothetical protein
MKIVTIEQANKDEIILAIKSELFASEAQARLEQAITQNRIKSLMREMERECENMDRNRQKKPQFDAAASKRWAAANARWNIANAKLSEILGN